MIVFTSSTFTDYCEFETFSANCSLDTTIMVTHARYGRMRVGRCVSTDLGFVGCSVDVLQYADKKCSGQRSCEIKVPDEGMSRAARQSCTGELKPYLEINATCVSGR